MVHVDNKNDPPVVDAAQPTVFVLRLPNKQMVGVGITGVRDPDHNAARSGVVVVTVPQSRKAQAAFLQKSGSSSLAKSFSETALVPWLVRAIRLPSPRQT